MRYYTQGTETGYQRRVGVTMPGPYAQDLRLRVLDAYENGEGTIKEIAQRFCVSPKAVTVWIAIKRSEGHCLPLPMGGARRPLKIDSDGEQFIRDWMDDLPTTTQAEMAEVYELHRGVSVSADTIGRVFKKLGYSKKKAYKRAPAADREDVVEYRKIYQEQMKDLDVSRLVFIDQFSICTAFHDSTGWSPVGEDVIIECPRYGSRKTVIGAITVDGPLTYSIMDGGLNGEKFVEWITNELGPKLVKDAFVILDNLPVHHTDAAAQAVEKFEGKFLFLPAYTPEFNPIELCWAFVKRILRHHPKRSMDALLNAFKIIWKNITSDLCSSWVRHAGYTLAPLESG